MSGQLNISESNYKQTCRPQVTLSGAWNGRKYKKIENNVCISALNISLLFITIGLGWLVEHLILRHQFKKAVERGDIEKASSIFRWTPFIPNVFIDKTDIQKLKANNQTEFLKFLDVQINYLDHRLMDHRLRKNNRENLKINEINKLFESIPEIQAERRSLKVIKFLKSKPHSPDDAEEQITPGLGIIMPQKKRNSSSGLSVSFRTIWSYHLSL